MSMTGVPASPRPLGKYLLSNNLLRRMCTNSGEGTNVALLNYEALAPALLVEKDGPVRIITLNKPDQLNAMSDDLHDAVRLLWPVLADDEEARAAVVTGAGRAFSAGGYIPNFVRGNESAMHRARDVRHAEELAWGMIGCRIPLVAAVNGPAVGLGCSIATMCDLVVMAEKSYMCDPHVGVGLTAADGGVLTWPLHIGLLRAKEHLLLSDRIPPQRCLELGLTNRVVPDDELMPTALELGHRLAALPEQAVQTTKQALNLHLHAAASDVLKFALSSELISFSTEDVRRIAQEFMAKQSK